MGKQLLLFELDSQQTDLQEISTPPVSEVLKDKITVTLLCPVCNSISSLGPHVAIHTESYMAEHWTRDPENRMNWIVNRCCSRKCTILKTIKK